MLSPLSLVSGPAGCSEEQEAGAMLLDAHHQAPGEKAARLSPGEDRVRPLAPIELRVQVGTERILHSCTPIRPPEQGAALGFPTSPGSLCSASTCLLFRALPECYAVVGGSPAASVDEPPAPGPPALLSYQLLSRLLTSLSPDHYSNCCGRQWLCGSPIQ